MSTEEKQAVGVEEFFSQLRGSMDLVTEACALILAKHPEKGAVYSELCSLLVPPKQEDSLQEKHRKIGFARALGVVAHRADLKESQFQSADIPPQEKH